jgi:hypothetical protein
MTATPEIKVPDPFDPLYYCKMLKIIWQLQRASDAHMAEARKRMKS